MAAAQTEIVDVPEKLKGLIIGTRRSGLSDISNKTGAHLFLSGSKQICVTGNTEQIQDAKAMIEKKLAGRNPTIITIPWIPGIKGELKRIGILSRTKVKWENVDDQCKVTITGVQENRNRANALIKEAVSAFSSLRKFGAKKFSCFIGEYADAKFLLEEYKTPPKLSGFIKGTPYRIKICSENNYEVNVDDLVLSKIKKELLPALQSLHKQKDEKALMVDLWCHFGAVVVHNVKEEEVNDETEFTLENINKRLGGEHPHENSHSWDLWKTAFDEGISREDVSKDDDVMKHKHTRWRYDYSFVTKSGRKIRFKSWPREQLGSDEPAEEVKNLLIPVHVKGQENALLSWLCHPSDTVVRGDMFVPNSKYDIRLKLRSGPRFVDEEDKSPKEDEEDKVLSEYLSHCTYDADNHQLNLPTAEIPLPEEFTCHFHRASQEDFYSAEEGDQTFTIIFLDEKGWDSDTKERRDQEQFGVRVVMDSWNDLLHGDWEPQKIIDMLPKYLEFFGDFQNILFQ